MFPANLVPYKKNKTEFSIVFDKQRIYDKIKSTPDQLQDGTLFCSYQDTTDLNFMATSEDPLNIAYIQHHISYQKNDIFLDIARPFSEASDNSMDFESGKEYVVYISYYNDKDAANNTKVVYGEVNKKEPIFYPIYIQKLVIPDDPSQNPYKVKAGAAALTTKWGAFVCLAGMLSIY